MTRRLAPAGTDVLAQAAEWFALLRSATVTEEDLRRWAQWRDASPVHGQAWAQVEAVSATFGRLPADEQPRAQAALAQAARKAGRRRQMLKTLGMLAGTGVLGATLYELAGEPGWRADYRSATGEIRDVLLADGGRVWLNTATAIDVRYDERERRIHLHAGEIMIQTAEDVHVPPRPFTVRTAHASLRALGTRFTVYRTPAATRLAVFEGAVAWEAAGITGVLQAGRQAWLGPAGSVADSEAGQAREAWVQGMLLADEMRLEDFLAELRRYRRGRLDCSPAVADLTVVGAYELADTDAVLRMLEHTLPVRVHRWPGWSRVLAR